MGKKTNLIDRRYGRLVVREAYHNIGEKVAWVCLCDCGNTKIATTCALQRGYTKSCGCLALDIAKRQKTNSVRNTRLYKCWTSIKQRCTNPRSPSYKRYGQRGIIICPEWYASFRTFQVWANLNGYFESLEIDRINNNLGYYPENCRWVTHRENCQNRSDSKRIKYFGETYSAAELARKAGIAPSTFREWIRLKGIEYALGRINAPTGAEREQTRE